MTATAELPTPAWTRWKPHAEQIAMRDCDKRFIVAYCGRRSGKTQLVKELVVYLAMSWTFTPDGLFAFMAPTRDQAREIYWDHLKALVPPDFVAEISETKLQILLKHNGAKLRVIGMDKPMRVQGIAIDVAVLDEYANMKPDAWPNHVRPTLDTPGRPPGRAYLIGRPEGRNHFYDVVRAAQRDLESWGVFHWTSEEILDPEVIREAKKLDELTYRQEYLAEFLQAEGQVYYAWGPENERPTRQLYDPTDILVICFDFNHKPGSAVAIQERGIGTCAMGEVNIPSNSTTERVCRKLISDWGDHQGFVDVYGDASGGAKGSAKVAGPDWDIVREMLGKHFGERFREYVRPGNPLVKHRVNSFNRRICSYEGERNFFADPDHCVALIEDIGATVWVDGADYEIDKSNKMTTHWTDAVGYYLDIEFPHHEDLVSSEPFYGN